MIGSAQQQILREALAANGLEASARQLDNLSAYVDLLVSWNSKMNLIGANSPPQALDLCLDSVYLAGFLTAHCAAQEPETWDLGAGAGLPGIPLRIFWPRGQYTMVEVRQKRALFLQTCLARLNLPGTAVYAGKAEVFMAGKQADLLISRAFMPQAALLALIRPHLAPGAQALLMGNQTWTALPNWTLTAESAYRITGKTRYLSLVSPSGSI